jgi:ABC-type multidrug transport system fused ATPase/permease subunit
LNAIEFENVSYGYANGLAVLDDCSFVVPRNKTTALVGASGGGKTTGFKLLCGYYDDYKGMIKVNGRSIGEWDLSALRKNMAYVSQENYLFDATIMDNIRYGRLDATDEEVMDAAKAAYADDFILQTENGYDTVLGERGVHLSGGQQQRLSIARAILKDALIILLDEPTAALDTKSEYYVQQALDNLASKKTVFVIAHRISTIENADNILVLEQGKIIEQGRHKELIARKGRYIELYSSQLEKGGKNSEEN